MQLPARIESIHLRGIECYRLRAGTAGAAGSAAAGAVTGAVANAASTVIVSRFGAQVLSWCDGSGRERLFLSERAVFDGHTPIRGGIPLCFPQFSGLGELPKHGFVRSRIWDLVAAHADSELVSLTLGTTDDAGTRAIWPHAFELRLEVQLRAEDMQVSLTVRNTGTTSFAFTGALHTYFAVSDIAGANLTGLNGHQYRDAAGGNAIGREAADSLVVTGEVDRVYHHVQGQLMLQDGPARLGIAATGFADVVVWNPWHALCARLPDMPTQGYRQMLCVEAAAAQFPVTVAAGEVWSGRQKLTSAGRGSPDSVDD